MKIFFKNHEPKYGHSRDIYHEEFPKFSQTQDPNQIQINLNKFKLRISNLKITIYKIK